MSKAEWNRKYRESNKEKINEHNKEWRAIKKGKYSFYKGNAKRRGIEFNLTEEEFLTYWQQDCFYCGSVIATIGIDRIDSFVGYSENNIVSCCYECNVMKMDTNEDEWYSKMLTILKHRGII